MDPRAALTRAYDEVLAISSWLTALNVVAVIATILTLRIAIRAVSRNLNTTNLIGPPRTTLIFGCSRVPKESRDPGSIYEEWARESGSVYKVPTTGREEDYAL